MDVKTVYDRLYEHFGPQRWWPILKVEEKRRKGEEKWRFEIMVGAILTQNTAWKNVERAIANLHAASAMRPERIVAMPTRTLQRLIRPAGYFRQKVKKLKIFSRWLLDHQEVIRGQDAESLRRTLLGIWGIGPETADSILLYALNRPVFVIDSYTRRLCATCGVRKTFYGDYQRYFESGLPRSRKLFNEYHALIVAWGKLYGNKKTRPEALRILGGETGMTRVSRTCHRR